MATPRPYQPPRSTLGGQGQRKASPKNEVAKRQGSTIVQTPRKTTTTTATSPVPNAYSYGPAGGGSGAYANSIAAQTQANPYSRINPTVTPGMGAANPYGYVGPQATSTMGQTPAAPLDYTQLGLMTTLYDRDLQPGYALNWLQQNGLTDNVAIAKMLADTMNPAQIQYMLETGGIGDLSDAAMANANNAMFDRMTTPGATLTDPNDLVAALMAIDPNGRMGAALGYGIDDPKQQAENFNMYLQGAMYGMNPYAQMMYSNAAEDAQQRYLASSYQDPTRSTNYGDFLRGTQLGQWYQRR